MGSKMVLRLFPLFLLGLILQVGVEYRVIDTEGRVNYYLVKEALPNGDYVVYEPCLWLGAKGFGMNIRPSHQYRKDPRWEKILKGSEIGSATPNQ